MISQSLELKLKFFLIWIYARFVLLPPRRYKERVNQKADFGTSVAIPLTDGSCWRDTLFSNRLGERATSRFVFFFFSFFNAYSRLPSISVPELLSSPLRPPLLPPPTAFSPLPLSPLILRRTPPPLVF